MIYITAGELYTDIDAFACAVAYGYLLKQKGFDNKVYLPGPLNASITDNIKSWNISFETEIKPVESDRFVIVDVSEPSHVAKVANDNNIIELFDHRYGFQEHYETLLGNKSKIEMVGSCATLIWEEYKKSGVMIDSINANLLIIAIVSNTLDFKSSVNNERDVNAFNELQEFIDLPENWKEEYFNEQAKYIEENPEKAIKEDTKIILDNIVFGQVEIWDGSSFIKNNKENAKKALQSFGKEDWMLSVPSISEGVNYIYTESDKLKNLLQEIIDIKFEGYIGVTSKLWLRKEIREKIIKLNKSVIIKK